MSKPYAVLLQEIKTMQAHAEVVKAKELVGVVAKIKEAIKAYSITMAELYADPDKPPARTGRTAAGQRQARHDASQPQPQPKYRDELGHVWGGRGPRPGWLKDALANGKSLGDFEV